MPLATTNVEMLKTGNAWEAADGTPLTWDEKRSPINVCAFAPYQKDVTMDGNLPIGVPVSYADANEVKAADSADESPSEPSERLNGRRQPPHQSET